MEQNSVDKRIAELGDIKSEAENALRRAWQPPFLGQIYEYARRINLQQGYGVKGTFDVSRSNYMRKPFESLLDRTKRKVIVKKAIRTGGSMISDLFVPYIVDNDPGDILLLQQDDDAAKKYMDTRLNPLLDSIPSIRSILENLPRDKRQKCMFSIDGVMSFICGGLNEGNVQSLGKRYVIIDEGWMARRNGLIGQACARTEDYPFNSKVLLISQGGFAGDDFEVQWDNSTQYLRGWVCPHCNKLQPWEFSGQREDGSYYGITWDKDAKRKDGTWDMKRVAETTRAECKYCGHGVPDTSEWRGLLDDNGEYILSKNGLSDTVGYWWPSMASRTTSTWGTLAGKYLAAKAQLKLGNKLPMVEFVQKNMARAWDEEQNTQEIHMLMSGDYNPTEFKDKAWPGEKRRSMQIDCQNGLAKFWWNVIGWGAGEARELDRGSFTDWGQLVKKQQEWHVRDECVFVDLGFQQTEVLRECVKHGHEAVIKGKRFWMCWTGLKGMDTFTWPHAIKMRDGTTDWVLRPYSTRKYFDPNIGLKAKVRHTVPVYYFSNLNVKNVLATWRDGRGGKMLCLPCQDKFAKDRESFTSQMHSEEKRLIRRPRDNKEVEQWTQIGSRPNHYWDCWCMSFVFAQISQIIWQDPVCDPFEK